MHIQSILQLLLPVVLAEKLTAKKSSELTSPDKCVGCTDAFENSFAGTLY